MALTAHEIWRKKQSENLTDEQFKQLLIDNGIIVKKDPKPSDELISMLTSYVQDNREDYALEVYNLCKHELREGKPETLKSGDCNLADVGGSLTDETIYEPIQNALYTTGNFTTEQCDQLTEGILQYIEDYKLKIVRQ